MEYRIPSGVVTEMMTAWQSLADQTYEIFGSECDIIYLDKVVSVPQAQGNNIPPFNSINARKKSMPPEYNYNSDSIKSQEVSEKIRVKIYWNEKEWRKIFGAVVIPENHVVILSKLSDSAKLNKSVKLRYVDIEGNVYYFTKTNEVIPYGFKKDRYASSIWSHGE
jgi:hypothetical protein